MNGEPLIDQPKNTASERFRKMADRIDHNTESVFGGAVVIYPPANAGDPIELLILDASADPAQFWSLVQTKAQIVLEGLKQQAQGGLPRYR